MGYKADKISGKAKELTGKATHKKKLEMEGRTQQVVADLKQKAEDITQ